MQDIFLRKGAAGFIFTLLVVVTAIPTITTGRNDNQGDTTKQLSYTFSFAPPVFGSVKSGSTTFTRISMPGCLELGKQPGDPTLPVQFIQLLLPPQEAVEGVTIIGSPVELQVPGLDLMREHILPAQKEVPYNGDVVTEFIMNEEVYSSHELYPAVSFGEYQIGYSHGYTIVSLALQPVLLIPGEGRLFYYPTMTVTINLQKTRYVSPFFRRTLEDEAWVKSLVSNPEVAMRYRNLERFEYPGGLCDPSDHYDYVIVTTTQNGLDHWNTTSETPNNWTSLIERHMAEGLSCTLVTVQAINACSDYWNSTYYPLFNDTQAHIREFCKDAYEDWGTSYVLVAGDSDFIPARQLYYEYEGNVDSDLYWSNLDKTFNADHDNQWGEEGDSGFDPYSELFIGRVTCDTPQDVSNWLTKSFSYADSADPDYLENGGFFASSTGWPPGGDGGDTFIDFAAINGTDHWYGSDPGQWPGFLGFLYGFETWNLVNPTYEFNLSIRWTAGYPPNPGWTFGDAVSGFRNAINNDSVTLITGFGHADGHMSLDVYDTDWQTMYHNTKPFFIIDLGSHCGDFDAGDDGILDTMLFHSNQTLAFGCLFATGYSWGGFQGTNSSDCLQTKLFWDYFFDLANNSQSTDNWQLGKGVAWSKDVMAPTLNWTWSSSPGCWRGTIEDRLLFADPAQLLKPPGGTPNRPPYISYMSWSPKVGLTVSAADPDWDDRVFLMIDWGDGTVTGWQGPYHSYEFVTFTHEWPMAGDYIVRARAKDSHDTVSDWSDLLVHVPSPMMGISIRGGLGITVKINNTGDDALTDITCTIKLEGFVPIGKSATGGTDVLPIGKSIIIRDFLVGLGRITVSVNVTCAEGATAQKSAQGFLFGIFVLGLK